MRKWLHKILRMTPIFWTRPTNQRSHFDWKKKQLLDSRQILAALSPGPFPAFQCYMLKNGRAWYVKSCEWRWEWKGGGGWLLCMGKAVGMSCTHWSIAHHRERYTQRNTGTAGWTMGWGDMIFTRGCHTWTNITGWTHLSYHHKLLIGKTVCCSPECSRKVVC